MIERESPSLSLLLRLQLTEEQQQSIRDQTGFSLSTITYASGARAIRIPFGGITLRVPRGVFVPSPLTERVLEAAVSAAAQWPDPVLIDVGTGCGAVALAAARRLPTATIYATDISEIALRSARGNRARLGARNVRFVRGSLLAPIPERLRGKVAVIVANVPYVPPRLSAAFAGAFPVDSAIGVGDDGLGLVRDLAANARSFLAPGGSLVLQLADFQWASFAPELTALGYAAPELSKQNATGPVAGRLTWKSKSAAATATTLSR